MGASGRLRSVCYDWDDQPPGATGPITVWGYSAAESPVTQPGGPVLIVNQGDAVQITLHNNLSEPTSLAIEGLQGVPDLTGVAPSGTKLYSFTASAPGVFLYEAGSLPGAQHQVAMGLYGALIVRPVETPPVGFTGQAYTNPATAFHDEAVLVLSESIPR